MLSFGLTVLNKKLIGAGRGRRKDLLFWAVINLDFSSSASNWEYVRNCRSQHITKEVYNSQFSQTFVLVFFFSKLIIHSLNLLFWKAFRSSSQKESKQIGYKSADFLKDDLLKLKFSFQYYQMATVIRLSSVKTLQVRNRVLLGCLSSVNL